MWKKNFNNIENEIIKKNNNILQYSNEYHKYKCIFHHPIFQNDCINSIDIINDKVLIGTIMGDVNLCRVDENNLLVKTKDKNKNINENNSINNISKETNNNNINSNNNINEEIINNKEVPCIQLKIIDKNDNLNLNNSNVNVLEDKKLKNYINYKFIDKNETQTNDKTNDKTKDKTKEKTRNKQIKKIKLNNKANNSTKDFLKTKKSTIDNKLNIKKVLIKNINIKDDDNKNDDINIRYDNTNIENKNNSNIIKDEKDDNNNHSNDNLLNINIKKFPQVTKLITKSNENIPCLEFDTDDKINISIGDIEVLCMENMSQFNINDKSSSYDYLKIKNYKNDNQHLKHCENCTCMMNSSQYLIIYTEFADFNTGYKLSNCKYKNRSLKSYKLVSGKIHMSNYSVPFDFDGNRFLFLDYMSKDERKICIYYTLSYDNIYEYNIEKDFGHISHMKIISKEDNKIFLCRNNNQCEIHLIDKDFTCIESWKHIGNDAISSFVYVKESKLTEEFIKKINSKKKINIDINDYDKLLIKNNNTIMIKKIKVKNKNIQNKNLEQIQGASSILNININSLISPSNNRKLNMRYLNNEYNHTENNGKNSKIKNMKSLNNNDISSKREFNYSDKELKYKDNEVNIYNKRSFNEELLNNDKQNKLYEMKKINKNNKNKSNNTNITIENENENNNNNNNNYYIITLDKNGNVNLYINKKVKTIFNLYELENIDSKYKKKEFFSVGFPYYIIMNELYIAITTDYGLFVISNSIND